MADQQGPELAYAEVEDRWLVAFADGSNVAQSSWDNVGLFVEADGTVGEPFAIMDSPEWDATGPLAYNEELGTFLATWRRGSDTEPAVLAREVGAAGGAPGSPLTITDVVPEGMGAGAGVTAVAARPHPVAPQFLVAWRYGNGGSGVFAGLVELGGPRDAPAPGTTTTDGGDGTADTAGSADGATEAGGDNVDATDSTASGSATGGIDPTLGQMRRDEGGCACTAARRTSQRILWLLVFVRCRPRRSSCWRSLRTMGCSWNTRRQ